MSQLSKETLKGRNCLMKDTIFRDGFPVLGRKFAPPETISLDPESKREITICNLFINHELRVREIVRVLDEDYGHVVKVLLNRGMVDERRQDSQVPSGGNSLSFHGCNTDRCSLLFHE
jgi:hypothetical protein